MPDTAHLRLIIDFDDDVDDVEADKLTANLRSELLSLDLDDIERPSNASGDDGAKSGDIITLGILSATVALPLIRPLLATIETWIKHRPAKVVIIEIDGDRLELKSSSRSDRSEALRIFASKHEKSTKRARTR